ncbi:hypothetical protein ACEQ8H_003069 [Pleosporales sp. CAS-2024a]
MRCTYLTLCLAALAANAFALPVAGAHAEVERPRSPASNVVKHNYVRYADADADVDGDVDPEFERPRSPAANVVKHDYNTK